MEAFKKKERQDETQFTTKKSMVLWVSPLPPPTLNVDVFFGRGFLNLRLIMTKLKVLVLYFRYFIDNFSFNPSSHETELNKVH
jgi:hypothetical protein